MNYHTADFRAYADLLVGTGVNLQPDQKVVISAGPGVYEFARLVAEACYRAGASYVNITVNDPVLQRHRALHAPAASLDYYPPFLQAEYEYYAYTGWARIALEELEDLEALEGVDADILGRFSRARSQALSKYRDCQMSDQFPWVVAAVPGPKWARRMNLSEQQLWEALIPIVRLDQPDPAAAWAANAATLQRRARKLTQADIKELHFAGPGTDLRVRLTGQALWVGGGASTPSGRPFLPNLPTEEVFTTPDFAHTTGRVQVTKPVEVLGTLVEGAWFEFEAGRVINFGATKGRTSLEKYFAVDAGAARLGEVALVGEDSPLARCGLVFGSGLLDENASCHIALGGGYPTALKHGETLTSEALQLEARCNVSLVHTDFMIGGPAVSVTANTFADREIPLLVNGQWTSEFAE